MIDRILVALDGSPLAEQALPAAAGLAKKTGAEIVLLTAIAPMERWANSSTPVWEREEDALAHGYLDTVARPLRDNGARVTTRVVWGRPAETICRTAEEESADLVLMTTHGRSGIRRYLIGSVADNVLRIIDRPLLLLHVHDEAPGELHVRRVLVPLDGSALAESVIPFARRFAQAVGASIILERVVVPPTFLYAEQYLPSAAPILEDLEADAADYLDDVKPRIENEGVKVITNVESGFPAETIIDAAQRLAADVIALTTHGRTGAARTLLGSVADGVVRNAGRPCLVIPARVTAVPQEESELKAPSMLGIEPAPTVVPPPEMTETGAQKRPRPKAPAVRPGRPERKP